MVATGETGWFPVGGVPVKVIGVGRFLGVVGWKRDIHKEYKTKGDQVGSQKQTPSSRELGSIKSKGVSNQTVGLKMLVQAWREIFNGCMKFSKDQT